MVADEVVETPYIVCKTIVLTVELISNIAALLAAVTLVLTGSVVYLHHVTQMANYLDLQ